MTRIPDVTVRAFAGSLEHLLAELERIDLLIAAEIARARRLHAGDEQFRGLYISEAEVDLLLKQPVGQPRWAATGPAVFEHEGAALDQIRLMNRRRCHQSAKDGIELRLECLERSFGLDPFEADALLVCLAVEMDLRYEKLYAYLQDDVTKKRPSVGLVLNLLAPTTEGGLEARRYFSAEGSLFGNHLLTLFDDPAQPHPPLLARSLGVDPRIVRYLLNSDVLDERIRPFATLIDPGEAPTGSGIDETTRRRLVTLVRSTAPVRPVIVHLRGPYGVGRHRMATAVCRDVGLRVLSADAAQLTHDTENGPSVVELVQREARLQGAAVLWKNFDALLTEDRKPRLASFVEALKGRPTLTFLAGEARWEPTEALRATCLVTLELKRPSWAERLALWSAVLDGHEVDPDVDLGTLTTTFRFTGGQIHDAAAMAATLAGLRGAERARLSLADLYEACRFQSNQRLSALARKIVPRYRWDDIILPGDRVERLREICNHMKYRERVHSEWGFDRKLSLGKGLSVLFSGPSGTGKTMAAEIIASTLGLELYKIDLSVVVSKYIGDTEKNLSRIFTEAETSNAILFFDEADALFGKRSGVKDSHDRYANIEIGYLLQRMEEYDGVVILATNLRKNMDEAFVRRLQFTVEFPFPDEEDRRRIWRGVWPDDTPRDPALDIDFMARRFEIAGGSIRNIALAAAFLAADDGNVVTMSHLMHATKREFQKMGKVVTEGQFRDGGAKFLEASGDLG